MEALEDSHVHTEFMPLSILRAIWKRKILIIGSWLLITALGAIVVYRLPAVYQARAVILIEQQRIPERFVESTVNEELSNRLNRISQMILSYEPLLRLIEEFNLYEDEKGRLVQEEIVSMMRENIEVSVIRGWTATSAPAFQITFEGENPSVVAQVTNRLATMLIDENLRTRANQALGTSEFMANQLEESRQEVERLEERLRDFRTANAGELPEQMNVLMAELRHLQLEYEGIQEAASRAHQNRVMLESSLRSAQASYDMLSQLAVEQAREAQAAEGAVLPGNGSRRAEPAAVRLAAAEAQLADLMARYSANHPDVVRQKQMVEQLREFVAAGAQEAESPATATNQPPKELTTTEILSSSRVGQSLVRERERISSLEVQLNLAKQEIQDVEKRQEAVSARLGAIQSRLGRIPTHEQELQKVVRDLNISQKNYEGLLAKRNEAELSADLETMQKAEKFTVLENARLPEKPIRPDRPMLLAITCVAGLFASCLLGFGVELRNNVLLGEWEIPPDVVVLGQVPFIQFESDVAGGGSESASDEGEASGRRMVFKVQRRALIASSVVLSLVLVVGASMYFGWISF